MKFIAYQKPAERPLFLMDQIFIIQNLYMKGFWIFIVSIGCSLKEVLINTAALVCFKDENLSSWLQVIHGCFGFGGLFGPILIYICELNSLTMLELCSLITILFYYMFETP
jgi:hypothetical protein